MRKKIIILGATGSIGQDSLDVIRANDNKFEIVGASAHKNKEKLLAISKDFTIPVLALSGKDQDYSGMTYSGSSGILRMLEETDADIVINGIAGSEGLMPSVTALRSGKDLALANKETIVMAGKLIIELAESLDRKIIPVDSEHSAIFHLLKNRDSESISEIILTASGGPFRLKPLEDFQDITLEDTLKHPTWIMGRKITIDSATMANKGLEVIEAHLMFSIPGDRIKVLIHPESRVHSLIRTIDSSMFAQISDPDMKVPIGNALFYPELMTSSFGKLDLADKTLTFFQADFQRYPLLKYAYEAIDSGGAFPLAYNAANEIAVEYFINKKIKFTEISDIVSNILNDTWSMEPGSFDEIIEIDLLVRKKTINNIEKQIRK